ncbi:hypothetical protein MMC07_009159 [Pseudocyphellaria aurata]|nr:hypothetical protein [Pseudocyphellaria aurata]
MPRPLLIFHVVHILLWTFLVSAYSTLSDDSLHAIPGPGDDFNIKTGKLLAPILRPRVPGSPGSAAVLNHFVDFFKTSLPQWQISFQNSTSKTPATGDRQIPFVNMIAARDPPWSRQGDVGRLTLVAHYDSKLSPEGFIGATDSAAPCAMLMHAARSVDDALTRKWSAMQAKGVGKDARLGVEEQQGIQIIFLDGEEAFVSWTNEDSLYGARSLAADMEGSTYAALSTYKNAISSISLFVLLDLLGAKNPRVPSYFPTTHWAYRHMATLEKRFRSLSLFKSASNHPSKVKPVKASSSKAPKSASTAKPKGGKKSRKPPKVSRQDTPFLPDSDKQGKNFYPLGMVQDDHIPFLARGVEVLHIIPTPFPREWHHMTDNGENLDLDACADWAILVTAFVGEWMGLDGYFEDGSKASGRRNLDGDGEAMISKTEL